MFKKKVATPFLNLDLIVSYAKLPEKFTKKINK